MHLTDKVFEHLLGNEKIGDHAVFEWSYCSDISWRAAEHTFRVKPDDHEFCEAPLGPMPCLDCAKQVPPNRAGGALYAKLSAVGAGDANRCARIDLKPAQGNFLPTLNAEAKVVII